MIEEREVITLILGIGATFVAVTQRRGLTYLTSSTLLLAAVSLLVVGWAATVLEGFVWRTALDGVEHASYGLSSLFVAIWVYRSSARGRRSSKGEKGP